MPIKCPGAPQKIAYLAAGLLRRKGLLGEVNIEYCTATPAMFSVPYFAGPLLDVAKSYGINVNFKTNLKTIDAGAMTASPTLLNLMLAPRASRRAAKCTATFVPARP
jgi:sulfide:quinone oxidoreductase